ncbi:MAG: MATE family efflux transporter [Pseudomonadales bacterium]
MAAANRPFGKERVDTPNGAPASPSPQTRRILEGPPLPLLLRMASPNAVAFLVQASVSMAEVAFVARLGTVPLAALALMFPGLMLMQMLANGALGGAVSSAVARALGGADRARAEALIWHALCIALVAGVGFYVAYLAGGRWLLAAFGASAAVTAAATEYADIVFAGALALWLAALLSAVFRGTGNMRFPAALMIVGAVIQVPLAGTLILGWFGAPALGLRGAALAVIAVAAGNGTILLLRLAGGRADLRLTWRAARLQRRLFADIFRVGALAALSPIFTVLTIMLVNALIAGFGVAALAGYGIVSRLEFLLIPMVFGLGAAMTSLVGVNMGARQVARAEHIGWLGGGLAAAITGVVGVVLALAPGLWLGLFTGDAATWAAGESYLRIVGPCFAFQGLGLSLYFASQGAGTVVWPVIATVLRFCIGVGGATLAVQTFGFGLDAVYVCLGAGMLLFGVVTAASIRFGAWRRSGSW